MTGVSRQLIFLTRLGRRGRLGKGFRHNTTCSLFESILTDERVVKAMRRSRTRLTARGGSFLVAEKIDKQIDLHEKTVVEFARVFDDECTVTDVELTAATEAALAENCLAEHGNIEFDLEA